MSPVAAALQIGLISTVLVVISIAEDNASLVAFKLIVEKPNAKARTTVDFLMMKDFDLIDLFFDVLKRRLKSISVTAN